MNRLYNTLSDSVQSVRKELNSIIRKFSNIHPVFRDYYESSESKETVESILKNLFLNEKEDEDTMITSLFWDIYSPVQDEYMIVEKYDDTEDDSYQDDVEQNLIPQFFSFFK